MKKTETINLGGIVFHIDEDAYSSLKKYLEKLEKELGKSEVDPREVMTDIEARIAEILSGRLSNVREVVTLDDINFVIEIIGEPEVINEDEKAQKRSQNYYHQRNYRKMYRDPDNRIIGGVCSGLSAYMNIDPVFLRIVAIVLTIFGGSGLVIYIIFWIILPEASSPTQKLEMRGESFTFENIKNFVSQEYENLKNSFNKKK